MINKAFSIVCDKVKAALEPQGFKREKADTTDSNEMVALFTGENAAYSVVYYKDKMHMVMRSCSMTEDGPDNDWKTVSTWMFDPTVDTEKEATSIGNDFSDAVCAPSAIKRVKQAKKKKSDDGGNADPVFFSKRLVKLFPELKDEIKYEEDHYYSFRAVTFTREKIVPKVKQLIDRGGKNDLTKLVSIFNAQYVNGDADTRSLITIVILNELSDSQLELIKPLMSDELKKAHKFAYRFKGKTVKPEKKKKPKMTAAQRLGQ